MFEDLRFAQDDARVLAELLQQLYEQIRRANGEPGYRLAKAAPERIVQLAEASVLAQVNHDIDATGKGNLLFFAGEETIEHIGYLYGERGKRLPASFAMTKIRYGLAVVRSSVTFIPRGSRTTPGGNLFFATTTVAEIPPGELYVDVDAQCQTAGLAGMGFEVGSISNMVDRVPFIVSAENITETSGGAEKESIEEYRARLRMLPESFSVAGPDGAYEFWARSANPGITDARAWMPELDIPAFAQFLLPWGITDAAGFLAALNRYYYESGTGPGNVNVAVLMRDGELPSEEVLEQVSKTLSCSTRRPLTDFVHVIKPETKEFSVSVKYWINMEDSTEALSIIQAVEDAVDNYIAWQVSRLGLDVVPSTLYKMIMNCRVKRVEILSPVFTILDPGTVAMFSGEKEINYMGLEEA